MKTLNTYINEWNINNQTVSSVELNELKYFCYEIDHEQLIQIFSAPNWAESSKYIYKVYDENNNPVELSFHGYTTKKYKPGIHKFYIKDINKVSNCHWMFLRCEELISVPLFDTRNVTKFQGMFNGCRFLKKVPLFDTRNANDMSYMFQVCESLKEIPKFNTSNAINMENMFYGCDGLTDMPLLDTRKAENMAEMFRSCRNLKNVPLFDTSNAINMENMFEDCDNLNEKTKQQWKTVYDFFNNCKI